jgi:hypothetical protein
MRASREQFRRVLDRFTLEVAGISIVLGWAKLYSISSALDVFFGSVLTMCSYSITDLQNVPCAKSALFLLRRCLTTAMSEGDLDCTQWVIRLALGRRHERSGRAVAQPSPTTKNG